MKRWILLILGLAILLGGICFVNFWKQREPLHKAALDGDVARVKTLIARGYDVNEKSSSGYTTEDIKKRAAKWNKNPDGTMTITRVIDVGVIGISLYRSDDWARGSTPLHAAVLGNNAEIVRVLIDLGADPNMKNDFGKTPYQIADGLNLIEIVDILRSYHLSTTP